MTDRLTSTGWEDMATDDEEVTVQAEPDQLEIEVVDDRPAEDQHRPLDAETKDSMEEIEEELGEEASDDEIAEHSERFQKRINKLKFEWHEQRRKREENERLANEAMAHARRLTKENEKLLKVLSESQNAVSDQATKRAELAISAAERDMQAAYEEGDPKKIAEAQRRLTDAQIAYRYAPSVGKRYAVQPDEEDDGADAVETQRPPEPDPKAVQWYEKNQWFGQDKVMTSTAYGVHEELVVGGVDPDSTEYYEKLDARMREIFPNRFEDGSSQSTDVEVAVSSPKPKKKGTVVAPVTRNNGATPQKITLTATQVRLAKRLGLSTEQYARQLLKENTNV